MPIKVVPIDSSQKVVQISFLVLEDRTKRSSAIWFGALLFRLLTREFAVKRVVRSSCTQRTVDRAAQEPSTGVHDNLPSCHGCHGNSKHFGYGTDLNRCQLKVSSSMIFRCLLFFSLFDFTFPLDAPCQQACRTTTPPKSSPKRTPTASAKSWLLQWRPTASALTLNATDPTADACCKCSMTSFVLVLVCWCWLLRQHWGIGGQISFWGWLFFASSKLRNGLRIPPPSFAASFTSWSSSC